MKLVRIVVVVLFLANLVAWIWITVDLWNGASSDAPASIALDLDAKEAAQLPKGVSDLPLPEPDAREIWVLRWQVQAGRSFRDAAIRWSRDLTIAGSLLMVNAFAALCCIVCQEACRVKAVKEDATVRE